jgi:hypothetical protein
MVIAMNDENSPSEVVETDPDIDKTPTQAEEPKPVSSGVWAMPEPVFKKTSGYLPQGFNKPFNPASQGNENTTVEQPKPEISQPQTAAPNVPDVEPQPDVIEDGSLEPAIVAPPPTPKKKGIVGRILMILLALIIVVLMAAVVVFVIWFVWPRPEGTIN